MTFLGLEHLVEKGEGLKQALLCLSLKGTYPSKLLKAIQDPELWRKVRPSHPEKDPLYQDWIKKEDQGYWTLALDEPAYPKMLLDIPDPPPLLYGVGDPSCLNQFSLALVGTRKSSSYGRTHAWQIGKDLAQAGAVIVSGLAYGIDSVGHRAALEVGQKTVAVLGTAIDRVYPASHQDLAQDIARQGCVISEYGPGFPSRPFHFLERNRIISGLARGLVVIEAGERSGTLNTASHAGDQGRDLFCLPGNVDQARSVGTNWLIQQGASLVMSAEDIIAAYPYDLGKREEDGQADKVSKLEGAAKSIYRALQPGPLGPAPLMAITGLEPGELWEVLAQLEGLGLIDLTPSGLYKIH